MPVCHEHNLARKPAHASTKKASGFGIRVKLRRTDPFRHLVGDDWTQEHWFATTVERDTALAEMSSRYPYFRPGDAPALDFEKIG